MSIANIANANPATTYLPIMDCEEALSYYFAYNIARNLAGGSAITAEQVAVAKVVHADHMANRYLSNSRKSTQKQYKIKYAKHRPSLPVLPVAKT
jgi:hypothetical protein